MILPSNPIHSHIGQHLLGLFVHLLGIAGHSEDGAATPAPQGDYLSATADLQGFAAFTAFQIRGLIIEKHDFLPHIVLL